MIIVLGLLIALLAFAAETHAQTHEGFLYGKVYTSRNTYTGPIRWGTEEALWTDIFNAAKSDYSYEKLVPKSESKDSWFDYDWNFSSIWEDSPSHQFTSQFGNFKEMIISHRDEVVIKLKNGGQITVDDDGNDIGEELQVMDPDLGIINVKWDNIDRIEFLPTPAKLSTTFGVPLYGTVEGYRKEKYTGFIAWDNDERLSVDKLDGDSDDGDVAIKFGDVAMIEKRGRGCQVTLKSGREIYLDNSNDVNDENRGVLVAVKGIGVVRFNWDGFRKVTFSAPAETGQTFDEFTSPRFRSGTVTRLGDTDVAGRIVFDIDEALDFEMIEGVEDDVEYIIPLKNIRKITPKNADYSIVDLVSGQSLLLGDGRDVSSRNAGLLVFVKGKKEPIYVPWRGVDQVVFD